MSPRRFLLALSDGATVLVQAASATAARTNYERDHVGGARVLRADNFGPIAVRHAVLRLRRASHERFGGAVGGGGEE